MTDGHDKIRLASYLYGECTDGERAEMDAHLAVCAACAAELEQMRTVRSSLAEWSVPERGVESVAALVREAMAAGGFSADEPVLEAPARLGEGSPTRRVRWELPRWAQVAAAVLVLGAAVGVARIEVRYDAGGLVVRTGWPSSTEPGGDPPEQAVGESRAGGEIDTAGALNEAALWRAELVALEQNLRREIAARSAVQANAPSSSTASEAALMRRVQALIDQSEQRQQRQLAERLANVVFEIETQRRTDLRSVNQTFGVLEGRTGIAVRENQEIADYLRRVSQQR